MGALLEGIFKLMCYFYNFLKPSWQVKNENLYVFIENAEREFCEHAEIPMLFLLSYRVVVGFILTGSEKRVDIKLYFL